MNLDNENIEPVTDLGLALGYSNQCVQRRSNNDSGAGANAGSRIDVTFVTDGGLSELVWSPRKGLSLNCTDSTFADTKASLFWCTGPSNVALSPPQSIMGRRSATEKPIDEDNFLTPATSFHLKNEVACKDISTKFPESDSGAIQLHGLTHEHEKVTGANVEEMNSNLGISVLHFNQKEELGNSKEDNVSGQVNRNNDAILSARSDQLKPDGIQTDLLSGDPIVGERDVNSCKHTLQLDLGLRSGVNPVNESEAFAASVPNHVSQDARNLEEMESTAENGIQNSKCEYACGATTKIFPSKFAPEVKENSQQDEEKVPRNNTSLEEHSPSNSRIHMCRRKGKEKALSDGDLNRRMSKDEDDSHESVESCNSAGISSTGKKRWSYEEDLIVGNKRMKKQIEGRNGSTSIVRQDSSFMTWISNMMKGFSKSKQDDAAPFALTLPHFYHKHENPDNKLITCSKNQESGLKNIGFQSIFQSLYFPKLEGQETRMLNTNYQIGEGSKELEPANKVCDMNATPIACHRNLGRRLFLLNDRFHEATSENEVESTVRPRILSEKIAGCQGKGDTNSAENKSTCNLACSKEEHTSSNCSLSKRKTNSAGIADFDPPSLGKTPLNYSPKNDPLASLWITRFASKTIGNPGPSSTPDHAGDAPECSTECLKPPHSQNHIDFLNVHKFVEAKENPVEHPLIVAGKDSQNSAAESKGYITMNRIKSHNDHKSMNKFNPLLPSPKLKISEAMASLFARRLDALKHIPPAKETDKIACAKMTCFFCGIKGHSLRDCSEISETELKEILKNLNRYSGAEELPFLCIRCFKHSHWAVACPKASVTARLQVESNISLDNHWYPSELQLSTRNEENAKLLIGKGCQFPSAVANTSCHGDDLRIETDFSWKANESVVCKQKGPCASSAEHIASESGENKLKEIQIMPLSHVNTQIVDVPRGLFDAVKRLQLSRTDILRCMNSHMSLSHLNGFFLRLRLGKWEGLGGTGYYVACITGSQREIAPQDAKSVAVNVGGIRCLVESRYVSNHGFLQDELMAWWSSTSRNGDKVPSEEDLRNTVKRKKMLGF